MGEYTYMIQNLGCPNCAAAIERKARKLTGVNSADVNFSSAMIRVLAAREEKDLFNELDRIVRATEKGAKLARSAAAESDAPGTAACSCDNHFSEHAHGHQESIGQYQAVEYGNDIQSGWFSKWKELIQLGLGTALFAAAILIPLEGIARLAMFLIPYIILGWSVLNEAAHNLLIGRVMDENFLMGLATAGAFLLGEYSEAVAVMLFFQVGEYFQSKAVNNSRKSVDALARLRVDTVHVLRDGKTIDMQPEQVNVGDLVGIRAGERVPLDCTVTEGESFMDTSAITGETVPRGSRPGDKVLAGYINRQGNLIARVDTTFDNSEISNIMRITREAVNQKAKTEQFITRFARVYTPVVVLLATLTAFAPPLILGYDLYTWVHKALAFLVISCPCALVISVPLAYYAGMGMASRRGMLAKSGEVFETLAEANAILMDKTGTLTKGIFSVSDIQAYGGYDKDAILAMAAALEGNSNHPVARSICSAYKGQAAVLHSVDEIAGEGVTGESEAGRLLCGNSKLMNRMGIAYTPADTIGTAIYVALDGKHIGTISVSDQLREDAGQMVSSLRKKGFDHIGMLTGDGERPARAVAAKLGIDDTQHSLLPQDKLAALQSLKSRNSGRGKVIFVGDGINDAPVLAAADAGMAMGGMGQDAAIESADAVLMTDSLTTISDSIAIARKTRRVVLQNIAFSLIAKAAVLVLAVLIDIPVFLAVFADVGVALLAVFNSVRILRMNEF